MSLYPPLEPYRSGALRVSPIHELHFEESGNPGGQPVLCLHGGPGAASSAVDRRAFDPRVYRIIQADQRGCGKSEPAASVEENTTWNLVADIEALREHLGIDRWSLYGGSWGATLALVYAERYPARVVTMVLRGVFLVRPEELAWFYAKGASELMPEEWARFVAPIPEAERDDLVLAYHRRLTGPDALRFARAWCRWEAVCCTLVPDARLLVYLDHPARSLALARIETHYFRHRAWLHGHDILAHVDAVAAIPLVIVHGRYDLVCPLKSAWDLHRAWPGSELRIIEASGHLASSRAMDDALVAATDGFRRPTP